MASLFKNQPPSPQPPASAGARGGSSSLGGLHNSAEYKLWAHEKRQQEEEVAVQDASGLQVGGTVVIQLVNLVVS